MTKILIVEDDLAMSDSLRALLELKGFQVHTAADGRIGVETARKERPDIILLDIMIPKVSGFDVCRILKEDPKTHGFKIIVTTGLGGMGDVETAFAAGADDYIIKPFDSVRLLQKIEKMRNA